MTSTLTGRCFMAWRTSRQAPGGKVMCYTTESYEDDVSVLRQINPNIIALDEKTLEAERRSYHTFFDVHVVETRDGYILIEEGDYGELPMHLIDQIVYTATGKMADEF
ncbi:MAG: hypothetical protein R3E14_08180 [Erythrobacter sp.]|uniref:hypothetical protein n=4 Tax=Alphaproteobacteria TaxID=28211 RepID=UPI00336AB833